MNKDKKRCLELHRLNLWDTGGSEHKESHADVFKAKLSGLGT